MPVFFEPKYIEPNFLFKNSFLQMMYAKFFRPDKEIDYRRERIDSPSGEFLDLDWAELGSNTLTIVSHGLESNSNRRYMRGTVKALNENNIDALAINFRGCSGEPTNTYFLQYGELDDLNCIVEHVLKTTEYENIVFVACSVGGNLILRYLSEKSRKIDTRIKAAFTVSPTVELSSSCKKLHKTSNWLVLKGFLFMLFSRVWQMRNTFKHKVSVLDFFKLRTFYDFYKTYFS